MPTNRPWFTSGRGVARGRLGSDLADEERPPRRFIAGADAIAQAEQQVAKLQEEIDAFRQLSTSLARDDVPAGA